MTLFDTRPGVKRVWEALAASTGLDVDADLVVSRLGLPLAAEMANWLSPDLVDDHVARYRSVYADHAIGPTLLLPGARGSLEAVKAAGGQTVVVTAKLAAHAQLHVDHAGLDVDMVVGDVWGEGKGSVLVEHGASVYVGDHVLDVAGARVGGAVCVAVATGPCTADELAAAGADVVLADLTEFPQWLERHLLERRLVALDERLRDLGTVMVAFSGGADSAFLLAAAARALGTDKVVAATALSDSLPEAERGPAQAFAAQLGIRHVSPSTHEMERAGYRSNAGDRCYFCKAELVEVLTPLAAELGLAVVATGTNADDALAGFRPGIRAAAERGAATPLLDAGLTKADVRAASQAWGLPTWDKPAAACLSSRIAYGIEVTPARLSRVERAEVAVRAALADHDIVTAQLRVRDLGDEARVEIDPAAVASLGGGDDPAMHSVLDAVRAAGFPAASVDPSGFRSGSLNALLPDPQRYR